MIVKLPYSVISPALEIATGILGDKALDDKLRYISFWFKPEGVLLCSYNGNTVNITPLTEAEVILSEGEVQPEFLTVYIKEINDALNSFKSLSKTSVASLEFHSRPAPMGNQTNHFLFVNEEPLDKDAQDAHLYYLTSKYVLRSSTLLKRFEDVFKEVQINFVGEQVDRNVLRVIFESLQPTIDKQKSAVNSMLYFVDELIYTAPSFGVCVIKNSLGSAFNNIQLSSSVVAFLRKLTANHENLEVLRVERPQNAVNLLIRTGSAVTQITCPDATQAFRILSYIDIPANAVAVDRSYLLDVLKRLTGGKNNVTIEVSMEGESGTLRLGNDMFVQDVPVVKARGTGKFIIAIPFDNLATFLLSHFNFTDGLEGDKLFYLYFGQDDKGATLFGVKDSTGIWHTRSARLAPQREGVKWDEQK